MAELDKIKLLQNWADHASTFKWLHDRSHKMLTKKSFSLSVPLLLLNTASGVLVYSTDRFNKNETSLILFESFVGSLNILCVILTGIKDYCKYSERSELHVQSYKQWTKFKNDIYVELAVPTANTDTFLLQMKTKYADLISISPIIPNEIIDLYESEFADDAHSMMLPDIIDGRSRFRLPGCDIETGRT